MWVALRARAIRYLLPILGVAAVTAICVSLRAHVNATTAALAFLLMVLFTAMAWGRLPAFVASVLAMLCFNFYFLPPIGTFTIADPENWVALGAFLITAAAVGHLSARVKRRAAAARMLARLQAVYAALGERALRAARYVEVIDDAVARVAQTLVVEYCKVLELMPDGKDLLLRSGVGWEPELVGQAKVGIGTDSQAGYTLLSHEPVVVDDLRAEKRFRGSPLLRDHGVVSGMSVIIVTREGPYGVLGAHTKRRRAFTGDEVNFLKSIANVLGAAIERKRDEEVLRESEMSLSRAQEIAHLGSWHLDVLHDRLSWSDEVFRIFGAPKGTPLTYEAFVGYIHPDDQRRVADAWGAAMHGAPYDVEHRIVVDGAIKWLRERAEVTFDEKGAAVEGIGTVQDITERKVAEQEIRSLNVDLEKRVAARTADLEAARKREIATGFRIQQMLLLDRPPLDVPGLHVAALTMPSQQIDGDFYDFYRHEDQCLDVIVADVMGKGIPAALLGAATKSHFIEALCHLIGASRDGALPQPKEIVTQAHAEMVQHLIELESFVTLCYVRFDLGKKSLTLVDCGHTGLIHWRAATRTCELLHGDNLPLGTRQGDIYDQVSVPFEAGDLLVLFSDGVTEARDRGGEIFGADRLVQCVQANSALEPRDLVEAVRKAALDFSGSILLKDDLTCVAIRIVERELPLARAAVELRSDLRDLARARRLVREVCAGLPGPPLDEDAVGELELAVTEACSNIVKHAYHGRDDQWIRLEAEVYPDAVSLRLHHLGDAFDPSKVPPPPLDGSRDSGFGVYLITKSVDDVRYFRDERGRNCIALVKRREE
jgi:sigma-B regulation protein RsbU (phosphoserine phosphatase)